MPDREHDPEWTLFFAYFVPCELMRQHTLRLRGPVLDRGREEHAQEFIAWTLHWFASLFVVVEGLKDGRI